MSLSSLKETIQEVSGDTPESLIGKIIDLMDLPKKESEKKRTELARYTIPQLKERLKFWQGYKPVQFRNGLPLEVTKSAVDLVRRRKGSKNEGLSERSPDSYTETPSHNHRYANVFYDVGGDDMKHAFKIIDPKLPMSHYVKRAIAAAQQTGHPVKRATKAEFA